jgi:transposase-like protein
MARVVITAVVVEKRSIGAVAREYGVSRRWVQKLVRRYESEGEAAFAPRARNLGALQAQLDAFTAYYNDQRPHRAVGRRTPGEAYHSRPKAGPVRQGLRISEHFRVRRDRVDRDGKLTLRHASRLHYIGVGRRWAGQRVLLLIRDLGIRIITDTGELIRELTLDPSKDYQPQRRGSEL